MLQETVLTSSIGTKYLFSGTNNGCLSACALPHRVSARLEVRGPLTADLHCDLWRHARVFLLAQRSNEYS